MKSIYFGDSNVNKRSKLATSDEVKGERYIAHIVRNRCLRRRHESHKHTKWGNTDLLHFIYTYLKQKLSSEIISVKWKEKTGQGFSHTSNITL